MCRVLDVAAADALVAAVKVPDTVARTTAAIAATLTGVLPDITLHSPNEQTQTGRTPNRESSPHQAEHMSSPSTDDRRHQPWASLNLWTA
jgi:hypothetical protein